jgi:hypothetical protein
MKSMQMIAAGRMDELPVSAARHRPMSIRRYITDTAPATEMSARDTIHEKDTSLS